MSEQNQEPENEIIDLGFDVTKEDVKSPLFKPGKYEFECEKVFRAQPNDKGNVFLNIKWKSTVEIPSTGDKPRPVGAGITQRIMMNPSGGLTEEMIRGKLQKVHYALAGEGKVNTAPWQGKKALLTISVREARTDEKTGKTYDASNEVDWVNPVREAA